MLYYSKKKKKKKAKKQVEREVTRYVEKPREIKTLKLGTALPSWSGVVLFFLFDMQRTTTLSP